MEGLSNNKEGKVLHSIRVLVKKILLIGIGVITNVYKLAAMVRVCNTGWACKMYSRILTLILLFTILYMAVSWAILHLSSSEWARNHNYG